jgi:hypothetical protein
MPYGNWFALIFLLILAYLVLNNSANTAAVVNALGTQATNLTGVLQGRNAGGVSGGSTSSPAIQMPAVYSS